MKLFNSKIEYGLKALSFLAQKGEKELLNARIISEQLKIPKEYTAKILQGFARDGIIVSKKGKRGGFVLTRDPKNISISEVFHSLGFSVESEKCILGFETSSNCGDCFINNYWNCFTSNLADSLNQHSLDYLVRKH